MKFLIVSLAFLIITSTNLASGVVPQANSDSLREHVSFLSSLEPARNISNIGSLFIAARYIEGQFMSYSSRVERQDYKVSHDIVRNVIASFGPEDGPRIIVGAHYDVCGDQPGADDNASGIAGLIELARLLSQNPEKLTKRVDLVAYTLEEPPFFGTEEMGSFIHAKALKDQGAKVELMISLEMIGFFSDESGSQAYPINLMKLFYPKRGNYITVVSNFRSRICAKRFAGQMKRNCTVPVERLTAPTFVTGIDWSDHLNYWHFGYRAIMITDTSFLRNKNYHTKTDTPETLDYQKMAEVINGVYFGILHFLD